MSASTVGPEPVATLPPLEAIKTRQQGTWSAGDYAAVGVTLQIVGETLCETADVCAGERVLDVAAGNGNATLAAARRFAQVTSTDYVEHLLHKGAARARAEGVEPSFRIADAENLPFEDASFDVVMSTFGVMFTPDQERAASELARVVRRGGRIALANWTPDSFIGQMFGVIGRHVPPPAGVRSPLQWGTEARLRELFGEKAARIECERRTFRLRYRSAEHFVDLFRAYYGPVLKAFEALEPGRRDGLKRDLLELLDGCNVAGERALVVPSEYLEVVIVRG